VLVVRRIRTLARVALGS